MPTPNDPPSKKALTRQIFVAPLGLYEGSTPAPPPENEVLVGREAQRARLLDLLLGAGRRGAYLITGYRGSGKTSFVDFSLHEFQEEVYERFVRGRIGRRSLDLLIFAFTIVALLFFLLVVSSLFDFWASSKLSMTGKLDFFYYLFGALLLCVLLLPVYHGLSLLRRAVDITHFANWADKAARFPRRATAWWFVAITVALLWFVLPFADPVETPIYFMAILGLTYGTIRAVSFEVCTGLEVNPNSAFPLPKDDRVFWTGSCWVTHTAAAVAHLTNLHGARLFANATVIASAGISCGLVMRYLDSRGVSSLLPSRRPRTIPWGIIASGVVVVAVATGILLLCRSDYSGSELVLALAPTSAMMILFMWYRVRLQSLSVSRSCHEQVKQATRSGVVCRAVITTLFIVISLVVGMFFVPVRRSLSSLGSLTLCCIMLIAFLVAMTAFLQSVKRRPQKPHSPWVRFHARPKLALYLSASFVLVSSLHLLSPVISLVLESNGLAFPRLAAILPVASNSVANRQLENIEPQAHLVAQRRIDIRGRLKQIDADHQNHLTLLRTAVDGILYHTEVGDSRSLARRLVRLAQGAPASEESRGRPASTRTYILDRIDQREREITRAGRQTLIHKAVMSKFRHDVIVQRHKLDSRSRSLLRPLVDATATEGAPGDEGSTEREGGCGDEEGKQEACRSGTSETGATDDQSAKDGRGQTGDDRQPGADDDDERPVGFRGLGQTKDREWTWLLNATLCFLALAALEYSWVIRRHTLARADNAREPIRSPSATVGDTDRYQAQSIEAIVENRRQAKATMFWVSMSAWRPTLLVRVNLGIDRLDHGNVITTMLTELRDQFRRQFVSWRSRIGLMSRMVWLAVVTLVSIVVGASISDNWNPPQPEGDGGWSWKIRRALIQVFASTTTAGTEATYFRITF